MKKKVFLVDDEEQILQILSRALEKSGIECAMARSAKEAISRIDSSVILMISDVGLPMEDGFWLFQEMKKLWPDLPIILMSGGKENEKIALDAGAVAFFKKPFDVITFVRSVQEILNQESPQ